MSEYESALQEQLDQLGQEIGASPELVERVANSLVDRQSVATKSDRAHDAGTWKVKASLATAATILIVAFGWVASRSENVYAEMLQALSKANTVHVSGWTTQVVRKWPLEQESDRRSERYAVDAWHWRETDGAPVSYERQGPVVTVRRGGEIQEYQEDVDLLYVYSGGYSKDRVSEFAQLGKYLELLQRPSLQKRDLGTRDVNGRQLRGVRHIEGNRIDDIWFDEASSLPVSMTRVNKDTGVQLLELQFSVNGDVPPGISNYDPPPTKNVRYDGQHKNTNLAWRQHVQEMGARLSDGSISGPVVLVPREDGQTFPNQWNLQTPGGTHQVMPLDVDQHLQMDLRQFIVDHAATEDGARRHGTWRVPREFHDFILPRSDLVYAVGTPWQEWMAVVLEQFDLECVDQEETRTIWIAKHDGRPLKAWQDVNPPVPYVIEGGVEKKGYVKPGIGHKLRPMPVNELFADFNRMIDRRDLKADKPWIIDKTNLPQPPLFDKAIHGTHREYWEKIVEPGFLVASDSPWFVGKESLQIARNWYRHEFGITFEEVKEPITIHVVRRRR